MGDGEIENVVVQLPSEIPFFGETAVGKLPPAPGDNPAHERMVIQFGNPGETKLTIAVCGRCLMENIEAVFLDA